MSDIDQALSPDERFIKQLIARRNRRGRVFHTLILLATLIGIVLLLVLLVDVAIEGAPMLTTNLLTNFPSRFPEKAGMKSGIVGSLIIIALTAVFSFPLGVGAAIYLEEYAPRNRLTDLININISNLAGVPSVVYGILGLALFARFFGLLDEPVSFNIFGLEALPFQFPFGRSLIAGSLTMTLLILPVVIIASREAIRAVPGSIRQAAYGLGATRWQVVSRTVLPLAMPGIMTGMILALSRAMGETAPLIIMGAFTYVPFLPQNLWDKFTAMPIQIYNWITLPQEEFRVNLAAAGIVVMLVIMLSMNGLAIYLRRRFSSKV